MNFFEHQDRARRNTGLLILYFFLAVIAIVLAVSATFYLALLWFHSGNYPARLWLASEAFLWSVLTPLALILFGSAHKLWQLRDGGEALASMLGAREVPPDTQMTDERRLRNVVEEMSLASGIPAPRTFLLAQEKSINAFVAGFRPTEVVVVVTQGLLDSLTREQLQGVIAHEFSHIFNADMRINMRLVAILAGVLTIGRIGEFLLHSRSRSSRRPRDGTSLALIGLALTIIGYVGLFFGRLIKAAISRQRELLADASAVQFTRNPAGLAGALIQIRNGPGSYLSNSHAEDMSHMCFGDTVRFRLRSLLATHPPLDDRLAALGNEWLVRARVRAREPQPDSPAPTPALAVEGFTPLAAPGGSPDRTPVSATVGHISAAQLGYARTLYQAIPEALKAHVQTPQGAREVVLALAVSAGTSRAADLWHLVGHNRAEAMAALATDIRQLGSRLRLPLLDLALPALKALPVAERASLPARLERLVLHDRRLTLFEFVLTRIVAAHLADRAGRNLKVRFRRYAQVAADIQLLLSLMVHASGARGAAATELFQRGSGTLLPPGRVLLERERCKLPALERALTNLRDLTPLLKGPLLDTLADMALSDGKLQVDEFELLRAVGSLIDCPVPPLPSVLPGPHSGRA